MRNSINEKDTLPPRFKKVKYCDVPENIQKLTKQMFETRKGLYIFGGCGSGKTHIAYAIWQKAKEKKIRAKFFKSTEMLSVIRKSFGRNTDEIKNLEDYKGILIIDDLGTEKSTDWVAETFYTIIDKRYEEMLLTIFTSNLSLDDLASQVSDRLSSRIAEMCEIIKVDGADRRI